MCTRDQVRAYDKLKPATLYRKREADEKALCKHMMYLVRRISRYQSVSIFWSKLAVRVRFGVLPLSITLSMYTYTAARKHHVTVRTYQAHHRAKWGCFD